MGLFSKKNKNTSFFGGSVRKKQFAFVSICRGPDPSGLTTVVSQMALSTDGMYDAMVKLGYQGPSDHVIVLGPDWNNTVYSSWKPTKDEIDDLLPKFKKELSEHGFTYRGENIQTMRFSPQTHFGQMGMFMTYVFIEK